MDKIMQIWMAFLGSMGFAMIFKVRRRHFWLASLGGMLVWVIYLVCASAWSGIFFPTFAASAFASCYGEVMARWRKAPATLFMIIAVVPLIPGSSLYYTLSYVVQSEWDLFRFYGYQTVAYAMGIAAGISLIWALWQMADNYVHRRERKAC